MIVTDKCYSGEHKECKKEIQIIDGTDDYNWAFCGCKCHEYNRETIGNWLGEIYMRKSNE